MSDAIKHEITEIEKTLQRSTRVSFEKEGDDFIASVDVDGYGAESIEGYEDGKVVARASSFEEAIKTVGDRLRTASNMKAQSDLAALNLVRTEAKQAAQMGKVSPFHKAINEGHTIEEATAIAQGEDPASARDLSPAEERKLLDQVAIGSTADPIQPTSPDSANPQGQHREGGVLGV